MPSPIGAAAATAKTSNCAFHGVRLRGLVLANAPGASPSRATAYGVRPAARALAPSGQHRGNAGQRRQDLQVPEVAAGDQVDRGHLAEAHIPVDKGSHRRGRGDPVGGEDPVQAGQRGDQNGGQRQQAPGSSRLLADRRDHVEAADRQYPEHRRDSTVGAAGGRGRVKRRRGEAAAHALCHDDDHRSAATKAASMTMDTPTTAPRLAPGGRSRRPPRPPRPARRSPRW